MLRRPFSAGLIALVCSAPWPLLAQAPPAAPAAQPAVVQPPVAQPAVEQAPAGIPDEPKTIDPATIVPAALAARVTKEFSETSLKDVVKWLQDEQKLGVLLDSKALADGRVLLSEPITDRLTDEPLYLLLDRLRTINVAWYLQKGVLHLTTVAAAGEHLPTIPYNLGDLLDQGYDALTLVQTIQGAIGGQWGQGGSLVLLGDVVFVMQTDEKQREVAGLLAALRKHGRRTFTLDAPQHAALRAKLEENVAVNFQDAPLAAVVEQLAALAQTDVRLDPAALRAAGVRDRSPVTFELADQTLATALQGLLADLNLTWVLRDGVLWITSRADAESWRKTAVYDVSDLCHDASESSALQQALVGQTRGPWNEAAPQSGTISFPRPQVMVVRQTETGQDDVLQLLENYRLALRASKPRQRGDVGPKEVVVQYYRLPTATAEPFSTILPQMVSPETWASADRPDAPGAILHMLPSTPSLLGAEGLEIVAEETDAGGRAPAVVVKNTVLAIRQTREAHERIAELIARVREGDQPSISEPYVISVIPVVGAKGRTGPTSGGFFSVPEQAAERNEKTSASPR